MSFRLYKEGQGTWTRGALAFIVGVAGLYASVSAYNWLEGVDWSQKNLIEFPFFHWVVKLQEIVALLILLPFGVAGIWLYNHARLTDFLIDTESELRNKVTWPTRRETANNSIVVVVTCVLLGAWVVLADSILSLVKFMIYGIE